MVKPEPSPLALSGAWRVVWRWHFYAGLITLPFLMLLSLTGGVYLFADDIDARVYRDLSQVEARHDVTAPERWVASAEAGLGGQAQDILIPARSDRAVRLTVTTPDGGQKTAFIDPHTAQLVGVTPYGGVMETIKRLHSLSLFGPVANLAVEIVAGWAIILVATGIYLWWPRGRSVGVMRVKARDPRRRPFWRDLHAVTGLYAGAVIAFLVVTGMPWSAVWGDQVLGQMRASGLGRPPAPAAAGGWGHASHADKPAGAGWTMEGAVLNAPGGHPGVLSTVIETAEAHGLPRPYLISIPQSADLAWTVARQVKRVEDTRTLYVNAHDGAVLADARYAQFGVGAKAFEWGIAVHQGTQYGWLNRWIMLGGCLAVWVLALSGLIMGWKRRPKGRLAAPPAPPGPRLRAAVLGIVLPLAILYPMTGLSLLVAVVLDRIAQAVRTRLRPAS